MTQINESILRRIKALLALGTANPNEHEAAAAAQKALELMEQYNIDEATIGTGNSATTHGERKQNFVNGGLYGWQRKLWEGACKLNFCMYWPQKGLKKGDKYQHKVLGSPTNVLSAQLLAEYLQQAVERLAQQYAKANGYNVFCREMIAYREGMTQRLVERLHQLREEKLEAEREREKEEAKRRQHPGYASSGTALVLQSVTSSEEDYNKDFLHGHEPGTHARWRAEREANNAAWKAEQAEKQRIHEEKYANDPEYKAEYDRIQAKIDEDNAAWWADYLKKEAKKAKRRGEPKPRYRAATAEEQRQSYGTYRTGYDKGKDVSLSTQVDRERRSKIGND